MRALLVEDFAPYEAHAIVDMDDPEPGEGEVVIETRAMSLNFPDVLTVEGLYQHKPRCPFIPGFDGAGVVGAVGSGVSGLAPGAMLRALRRVVRARPMRARPAGPGR